MAYLVVEELRAYAKIHPEARTVNSVLDAIQDRLVQEILGIESAEGEEKLPVLLLEELAALFPDSATPLLYLSKICLDKGDHNEALEYAEAGLRVEPDYPDLVFNRALALLETGKHEAGNDGLRRYIELNAENPWAYNNIGDAYRKVGNYDEAEKYFKLAIERDDRFFPAIYNLVMLCTDQKDWTRCIHHAQIAERLDPSNKEVQLALGDAYMGLDDPRSALEHLVKATLIDKDFAEAYETMSCSYVDLGMHQLGAAAREGSPESKSEQLDGSGEYRLCRINEGEVCVMGT